MNHDSSYKISGPIMEIMICEWLRLGDVAAIAQAIPTLTVVELAGLLSGRMAVREGRTNDSASSGLTYEVEELPLNAPEESPVR